VHDLLDDPLDDLVGRGLDRRVGRASFLTVDSGWPTLQLSR
jgi:hypothetical protein